MTGDETRDAMLRAVAVIGLAGVALIHLLDAHETIASTPYKAWLYVGLLAGSLAAGAWSRTRPPPHVVVHRSRAAA